MAGNIASNIAGNIARKSVSSPLRNFTDFSNLMSEILFSPRKNESQILDANVELIQFICQISLVHTLNLQK